MYRHIKITTIFLALSLALAGCAQASAGAQPSPLAPQAQPAGVANSAQTTAGTLIVEPQTRAGPYIDLIYAAKHDIAVNSYLLTDRDVVAALIRQARAGIRVNVLVAGNPYHDSQAVAQEMAEFAGTPVQIKASPRFEGEYTYDHAKYVVADPGQGGQAILGSSNLTYSGLGAGNREYDYQTANTTVVADLALVFNADWTGQKAALGGSGPLVISPGSETSLVDLIQGAKRIFIESEELGYDGPVLNAVAAAARRGMQVEIVLPEGLSAADRRNAEGLAKAGVHVRYLANPYPHAKLIIADNRAFLGSQNISSASLDRNREVGIVLTGRPVDQAGHWFEQDFAAGR